MLNITFKNVQKIPTLFYETACLLFLCWKTNSILNIGKKCKHIHARVNFSIFPNKRFVWNKALKIVLIRPSSYHVIMILMYQWFHIQSTTSPNQNPEQNTLKTPINILTRLFRTQKYIYKTGSILRSHFLWYKRNAYVHM